MHLLTLLFATVFSSQFVAPNAFASFTADLKWIDVDALPSPNLPSFTITLDVATTTSLSGVITKEDNATAETKVDLAAVDFSLVVGTTTKYTVATKDVSALGLATTDTSIYIFLKDEDAQMTVPVKLAIPIKKKWSIEADRTPADTAIYDTDLAKLPKLKLVDAAATPTWTTATVTVTLSWTTADTVPVVKTQDLTFTKDANDVYILAAGANLNELEILEAQVSAGTFKLEAVVTDGTTPDVRNILVPIAYTTRAFVITNPAITEVELLAAKEFTITTSETWTGMNVTAVVTTEKIQPTAATGAFAFPVTVSTATTFSADLSTMTIPDDLKELYVYIYVAATTPDPQTDAFLPGPRAIAFTPEQEHVGSFNLTGATVEWKNRATTPNITVVLSTSPAATPPTAKARYEIVYAADPDNPVKVKGPLGQTAGAAPYFIDATSLVPLGLPNAAATLQVYIFPTGTRNAYTTSKPLTVTPSTAEFTVGPSPITSLTTIDKLTITATDGTDWSNDGIAVKLSFESATPIVKNLTLEVPEASTNQVVAKVYSLANVDITTLGLADGDVVTVEAAKAQHATTPVWLPIPVPVTVTLPVVEEETFTLTPAWMLWAADLKTTEAIIVEPSKEVTWTTPKATFTYTAPGPVSNDPAPVEVTLVKAGTPEKWTIPKATALALLEVPQPAEGEFATVNVTVHNGAKVLAHEFPFKVYRTAPAPGPETITFTLAPNKMDFATAMKTPVIEVKPGAGANWPAAADPGKLKATFKYGDKPDIAADLAVEGTTTKKYTIPKDVDLSTFGIKETECPKVIKVHIKDGAVDLTHVADFTVNKPGGSAAMGVSPLLSLLAAALLLLVKLF